MTAMCFSSTWRESRERLVAVREDQILVIVSEYGKLDRDYVFGSTDTYVGQFDGFKVKGMG